MTAGERSTFNFTCAHDTGTRRCRRAEQAAMKNQRHVHRLKFVVDELEDLCMLKAEDDELWGALAMPLRHIVSLPVYSGR